VKLIQLQVSEWGIDLQTYFGDIFLPHRTWMLALGIVVVLRTAKLVRKAWK